MWKKTLRAFTNENISSKIVIGNPACIFLFEKNEEFLTQLEMESISKNEKQPITVFVKYIEDNKFDIRYFFPDGEETNFCGHGTICATKAVSEYFKIKDEIFFYFNKNMFKDKNVDNKIKVNILENGFISMEINKHDIEKIENNNIKEMILKSFYGLNNSDIKNVFKCNELNDYIVHLHQDTNLNNIRINEDDFMTLDNNFKFRACALTKISNISSIDYEVRLFASSIIDYEDIVCGSSSCYLSTLCENELKKNNLVALFPYNNFEKYYGGVEYINVKNNEKLILGGYVK